MSGIILVFFGMTAIILYSSFAWGFVCFKFWHWFLTPIFTGLPEINYIQAVGIILFISLFRNKSADVVKEEYRVSELEWTQILVSPWIALFIGYLIYNFI